MTEDGHAAEQRRRGIPPQLDPRNFDPRNLDPRRAAELINYERMAHAQQLARAQAAATSTVVIATMVSLVTSAFGFVAALAWNTAIQTIITENEDSGGLQKALHIKLTQGQTELIYAFIVTVIAVAVIIVINRFARGIAKNSVINASGS